MRKRWQVLVGGKEGYILPGALAKPEGGQVHPSVCVLCGSELSPQAESRASRLQPGPALKGETSPQATRTQCSQVTVLGRRSLEGNRRYQGVASPLLQAALRVIIGANYPFVSNASHSVSLCPSLIPSSSRMRVPSLNVFWVMSLECKWRPASLQK